MHEVIFTKKKNTKKKKKKMTKRCNLNKIVAFKI